MSSELPEGDLYIEVNKEDLAGAPPGVLEFLLNLCKRRGKTGRQDRRKTETGLKTQQERLGELIESLTDAIQKSAKQHPVRSTTYDEALSWPDTLGKINAFVPTVNALGARQHGDLGAGLPIGEPPQKVSEKTKLADDLGKLRAEVRAEVWAEVRGEMQAELSRLRAKSESGEASALSFDCDVVMVDVLAEAAEHGQTHHLKPPTHKQLPGRVQDDAPAEDLGHNAPLPDLSKSDSGILEEMVRFGMSNWPEKKLDQFRSGQLITAGVLNELLLADLPVQYALGVPSHRVNKLKETCVGIVIPYHVNDANQLSKVESEKNHFVIAIVNKQNKTFISWGMSEAIYKKLKAEYEKALDFDLSGIRYKLGDYTGNCCAFRCVEAMRSYFNIDTTTRNEVSLRLFFLKRLMKSWIGNSNQAFGVRELDKSVITAPALSQPLPSRGQPGQTLVTTQHTQHGMAATGDSPLPLIEASPADTGLYTTTGLPLSDQIQWLNSSLEDVPETAVFAAPHQPTIFTPAQYALDASPSKSSGTEATNDSAGRVSASPCLELARTPLPSAGRNNSQAPSMQSYPHGPPRKFSRKLPANEAPALVQSLEKDGTGTESAELPAKRKDKKAPSPEILAGELTGSGATERIRRHVLACNRDTAALPKFWDKQGDWVQQTCKVLNLGDEWDEKSEFSKLVALILRTHGVERIYIKARSILQLDKEAPDPNLPEYIIDQVYPQLRERRTPVAFRRWLTLTRKLFKLVDYLPFMPFNSNGPTTFRHYERLANEDIQQLRNLLDNNLHAQDLAKIGRAFRKRILKRQDFLWEHISSEELSKLPDDTFLHLLTIRRGAEYDQLDGVWYQSHNDPELTKLNSVSKKCDLCEGEICKLFTLCQDLASKQPTLPAHDTIAQHNNIATGVCQTWTSETSPSASTPFQTTEYSPSGVLLTLADSSASQPLLPTCNAFRQAEQAHISDTGPQLQLALRRRVPDTAQSIAFAMNGDIDGLKRLFCLGLASPRDESDSRGFSLIRWALYGGMHNYETVQFLLNQGAHVDDESYEHVWDYRLRGKCTDIEQQALHCIIERRDRQWFDEQEFPLVHKIIFGLSPKPLMNELLENPNAVSATDAQGRTALDWATSRAQLDDMRLLIACGSNPNTMDVTGRTTVLHAVDSHNVQALRIVLEAGADPNPQMPEGLFRSSPITAASYGGLAEMIKLLVQFNAKIDADNPEGRTALQTVAVTQNVECAVILLQYGADMDHVSSNGCTPLMTAIIQNKHTVLRVFLSQYTGQWDSQLLPIIAQHADSRTMSILASKWGWPLTGHDTLGHAFRESNLCLPEK